MTSQAKQRTTPERWHKVAREEVLNNKDFLSAMLTAQYSESYSRTHGQLIKKDDRYCKIKDDLKAQLQAETDWNHEKITRKLSEIIDRTEESNPIVALNAIDKINKHTGYYELDNKQRGEAGALIEWLHGRKQVESREVRTIEGVKEDD